MQDNSIVRAAQTLAVIIAPYFEDIRDHQLTAHGPNQGPRTGHFGQRLDSKIVNIKEKIISRGLHC